jgi:hypothetical protein
MSPPSSFSTYFKSILDVSFIQSTVIYYTILRVVNVVQMSHFNNTKLVANNVVIFLVDMVDFVDVVYGLRVYPVPAKLLYHLQLNEFYAIWDCRHMVLMAIICVKALVYFLF